LLEGSNRFFNDLSPVARLRWISGRRRLLASRAPAADFWQDFARELGRV
jgi:hypothetical protein